MKYSKPEIEMVKFDLVDLIQTSAQDPEEEEGGNQGGSGGQYETPVMPA